ncbi:MAG: hypothetical protein KC583_18085 [Myxococcales bacterium]|nr:hypothetical protein [Myxococcales bacterium]
MPKKNAPRRPRGLRPFWSGTVTFGLVSIPVELFTALRSSRVSLRALSPAGRPLRRRYVCSADDQPIDRDDIVRGYEYTDGQFVTVTEDELDALQPERTREIDLQRFVPRDALDPLLCDRAYFLLPPDEVSKPYRLLAATMERTDRVGIAAFVMRGRSYLIAIFAQNGILRAETLRTADELRSADDVGLPAPAEAKTDQVKAMRRAIRALAAEGIDPAELSDVGAEALRALAEEKARQGQDVVDTEVAADADEDTDEGGGGDVVDIVDLLRERLGGQTNAAPKLSELTKSELYERAKRRGIEGRSGMSKDQLVDALAS